MRIRNTPMTKYTTGLFLTNFPACLINTPVSFNYLRQKNIVPNSINPKMIDIIDKVFLKNTIFGYDLNKTTITVDQI